MIVKTRVFELCNGKYQNLTELARAMGISVSQVYRVRENKRSINQKFILGAIKAFPECRFSDLFYIAPDDSWAETAVTITYHRYGSVLRSSSVDR
jgi:DNA-binding Xre family transcriptional regulator